MSVAAKVKKTEGAARPSPRRLATEAKLTKAVGKLIRKHGAEKVGVNAVAAEAGVDKVLIYRYFGGLDGLLQAYGESADFWPTVDEMLGGPGRPALQLEDPGDVAAAVFRNLSEGIRRRPVTLELLAWECVERGPLTAILEELREKRSDELMMTLAQSGLPLQGNASIVLGPLFAAALNYLNLRGRHIVLFGGLDIGPEADLEPVYRAIGDAFRALWRVDDDPEPGGR